MKGIIMKALKETWSRPKLRRWRLFWAWWKLRRCYRSATVLEPLRLQIKWYNVQAEYQAVCDLWYDNTRWRITVKIYPDAEKNFFVGEDALYILTRFGNWGSIEYGALRKVFFYLDQIDQEKPIEVSIAVA